MKARIQNSGIALARSRHHRRRRGQLSAAQASFAALGLTDVPLVAIAKGPERDAGRETFFVPGRDPFKLKPRDPVLYFVQRLRDEAHRFAIGSHRARRKKDIRESGLQEIAGVGPARKRALLQHFGTLKAIERASPADLANVEGVSDEMARDVPTSSTSGRGRGRDRSAQWSRSVKPRSSAISAAWLRTPVFSSRFLT